MLERITYEPLELRHYTLLFKLLNNPDLIKYTYHPFIANLELAKERVEKVLAFYKNTYPIAGPFIIFDQSRFIGFCGIDISNTPTKSAEIWYIVDSTEQGKGYGKNIAKKLTQLAFESLNVGLVTADVVRENNASRKVLSSAGLALKQELPLMFNRNGIEADLLKYSISKEDWLSLH